MKTYHYTITVEHDEHDESGAVAYLNERGNPMSARGETPILALSALSAVLARWPDGGSAEWLATVPGRAFLAECHVELGMGGARGQA